MKKKILIVSDTPTHPVIGGNRMCILQNAHLLKEIGFEVFFLLYDFYGVMDSEKEDCRSFWGDHFFYFTPSEVYKSIHKIASKLVPSLNRKVDFFCSDSLVSFINKLHLRENFEGLLVNYIWLSKLYKTNIPKKALYTHDVFSNRADRITANYKWMSFPESEEGNALRRFDHILAIQSHEAIFFSYLAPKSHVISIFSPIPFTHQPLSNNHNVLYFSGGGELNNAGLQWYLENIHHRVAQQIPDYKLLIGGSICRSLDPSDLPKNVELKGIFANPSDFYIQGDIAINPVRGGTGLKIKTLEAIAHGKYTVVHPHSAEGLYEGRPIPLDIASEPGEFASSIISTFADRQRLLNRSNSCQEYITSLEFYIRNSYRVIFY